MRLEPFALETWLAQHQAPAQWDFSTTGMGAMNLELNLGTVNLGYGELSGTEPLRRALAQRYPHPDPERILVTQGAIEANLLAMTALLNPGDRVLTIAPGYQQYTAWPRFLGATVEIHTLSESEQFGPELLAPKLPRHPLPKLIILNHPHNPTGKCFDQDWLRDLLTWADHQGIWVLVDEVYRDLQPMGRDRLPSVASLGGERVIISDSFAKSLGAPGLRIGWLYAPPDLLAQCRLIKDYLTISPSRPAEAVALGLLAHWPELWTKRYADYQQARAHCLTSWPDLPLHGGAMAWLPCPDPTQISQKLLQAGIMVVPGSCFGDYPALRIGFGNLEQTPWQKTWKLMFDIMSETL